MNQSENETWNMNFLSACNWLTFFKERDEYIEELNNSNRNKMTM